MSGEKKEKQNDLNYPPMKFKKEHFYFSELDKMIAKCIEEAKSPNETMPDDKFRANTKVQLTIHTNDSRKSKYRAVLNSETYERFRRLCSLAIEFAEKEALDVIVEYQGGNSGEIKLLCGWMNLSDSFIKQGQRMLAELIINADSVWIDTIDRDSRRFIQIKLFYNIYDVVQAY